MNGFLKAQRKTGPAGHGRLSFTSTFISFSFLKRNVDVKESKRLVA